MATKDIQATVIEEPVANPASVDPTVETEVPAASKENKTKKPRKPRAPASHPPYIEMIQEALTSLKEKTGSSQYAITKFIEEKHKDHIPPNFKKLLLFHLRKLTAAGKLIKVKNSYKIPAAALTKAKATSKPKPKVTVTKPRAKPSADPKAKAVAAKPKTKSIAKLKPVAKVAKPKPKTVAANPTARPPKAAKTSEKDAPGKKKVDPAATVLRKAKRVKPTATVLRKAKRVKPTAKIAAKKTPRRKI